MRKLQTYRVTFSQPMLTTIVVKARNEDRACELATVTYVKNDIDFSACTFGEWEIADVDEVSS